MAPLPPDSSQDVIVSVLLSSFGSSRPARLDIQRKASHILLRSRETRMRRIGQARPSDGETNISTDAMRPPSSLLAGGNCLAPIGCGLSAYGLGNWSFEPLLW